MKTKENVYGRETGAKSTATAEEKEKEDLTALGKFKDVNALARAYTSLQAEFTRRSQKLKELERAMENFSPSDENARSAEAMAEKLRQKAVGVKAEERAFDEFVSELETANVRAETDEAEEPVAEEVQAPATDLKVEEIKGGDGEFVADGRENASLSSDELYALARGDEQVRLKIIGEYLSSVGKGGVPLLKGGTGGLVTPPLRAKTLSEAGDMTLRFLRTKKEN